MAVDLTTGSYDEEGIFNKHNDAPKPSVKVSAINDFCSLKNFRVLKVLKECTHTKTLVVEGRFVEDDRRAIIAVEKMPFDERDLNRMFTAESRVELKFRNDVYTKYHVYPQNGFNGISIKVIHPANDKDFAKFIDEPIIMVYEMKMVYDCIVGPHFQAMYEQQAKTEVEPEDILLTDTCGDAQFLLLKEDVHNCGCPHKHIRAKAIVKRKDLLSLRDLTYYDIPLLIKVKETCFDKLRYDFKVPHTQLECYVYYPPQNFPFQVIFESVEKDEKIPVGKVHHLDTIISNLRLVPDYYQKVTLTYFISEKESLGRKLGELNVHPVSSKK